MPPFASLPSGPGAAALFALCAVLMAAALLAAQRRGWPLSFRRVLLLLLLLATGSAAFALLPPEHAGRLAPHFRVYLQFLAWVAAFELVQGLLLDLLLGGWLRRPPTVPRILRDFLTLLVAILILFLALRGNLGVNVTSLLATSAMLTVVVGLALQDTLGSFFSGLALQMERPLAIDDWIRVGDQEGQVTQVTWRAVRIRTPEEDEVTIPNALLARSVLLNYSRPTLAHMHVVDVRVPFDQPAQKVMAVLEEAMRRTPGVIGNPAPHTLLWQYGPTEIVYRARFYIDDYRRVNRIKGAVGTSIWYALNRAGIPIPVPEMVLRRPQPGPRVDPLAVATAALDTAPIFGPLSEAERRSLAARLCPALYGRGEAIIRQGEPGDSLFVVTSGRVEVRVAEGAEEGVVATLGPGSVAGEMSLLTGAPRSATIVAIEDALVVPVAREDFRHIAAANPAVLEGVARIVSERRGRLEETIRETEQQAAAHASHADLLEKVRAFFGV
jgi:small-conductance mechanosensitive channel/CRP-like cAMP-binding protein